MSGIDDYNVNDKSKDAIPKITLDQNEPKKSIDDGMINTVDRVLASNLCTSSKQQSQHK